MSSAQPAAAPIEPSPKRRTLRNRAVRLVIVLLLGYLVAAYILSETYVDAGFHKTLQGRNGGGDPWHTDGALDVGVIAMQK